MADKRMLIVPADLVRKIDENRGDLSRAEFLNFLMDSHLEQDASERRFVTQEELHQFERATKELLRSFLDFFVSYGMELGGKRGADQMEALSERLQGLDVGAKGGRARDPKD